MAKYSGTELYKKIMNSSAFERGRYRDAVRNGYFGIDEDLKKGIFTDGTCLGIRNLIVFVRSRL